MKRDEGGGVRFCHHSFIYAGIYSGVKKNLDRRQNFLVIKDATAPRAANEPVAARIIAINSPVLTAMNPKQVTYRLARRPLFGLA